MKLNYCEQSSTNIKAVFTVILINYIWCNIFNRFQDVEYTAKAVNKNFKVIWNMPTFTCQKYGINFTSVSERWGMTQNSDGMFRGDVISLLYDPGDFPALLDATGTTKNEPRNGGVPQEGNITLHLKLFKETLSKLMPNSQFNGKNIFCTSSLIYRSNSVFSIYNNVNYFDYTYSNIRVCYGTHDI